MKPHSLALATRANETLFRQGVHHAASKTRPKIILDLGSGDGSYSIGLGQELHAKQVICVDHDPVSIAAAQAAGAKGVVADLNQPIPLPTATADLILANQVIEHLAKTDTFIKEIRRLLKPGGQAIICTPNLASWHNIGALVLGWQPFSSQVSDDYFLGNPLHPNHGQPIPETQAHLRLFTHQSLAEICLYHNLKVANIKGVGFYPFSGRLASSLSWLDPWHSAYLLVTCQPK